MKSSHTDQASVLRAMIDQNVNKNQPTLKMDSNSTERIARTIAICSGKGGVGKSLIALNLAISLSQSGRKVCLLDANLGLGNLDLLCGLNGYWNLSHVLSGSRRLEEIILQGPAGVSILPGASGLSELADLRSAGRERLIQELTQLEQQYDYFLIDNGTGISRNVRHFACSADTVLLVSSLEATSLADTYAALKIYRAASLQDIRIIFNRAEIKQAKPAIENLKKTARQFLQCDVNILGCVPEDARMQASVTARKPLLLSDPNSAASLAIGQLARLLDTRQNRITSREERPFIKRLYADQHSAA